MTCIDQRTTQKQLDYNSFFSENKISLLSKSLIFNLLSYCTELSLVNFGSSSRTFDKLHQDFLTFTRNKRFDAWQKIFQTNYRTVDLSGCQDFRVHKSSLSWHSGLSFHSGHRIVFDPITRQQNPVPDIKKQLFFNAKNERISVIDSYDGGEQRTFTFFDNETCKILDQITTPVSSLYEKYWNYLSRVLGINSEDQNIQMITKIGLMYLWKPFKVAEKELDAKEKQENRITSFYCWPKKLLEDSNLKSIELFETYKVGKSFYFYWVITNKDKTETKVVTFLKDINNINTQTIIQNVDLRCRSDDYFFYAPYKFEITIYRCGNIWKKIHLDNTLPDGLFIFPTREFIYTYQCRWKNNKKSGCVSTWIPHNKEQDIRTPIAKESYENLELFVEKDLLFYVEDKICSIFHTSTNKKMATLNLSDREVRIWEIIILDDPLPKCILFYCLGENNTKNELLIYSLDLLRNC